MSTVLLIDGTNCFLRYYCTYSTSDINGEPNGGVVGTLKHIESLTRLTRADKVIIAFDAPGGSQRRRKMFAEYKHGRKPRHLNRHYDIRDPERNKQSQQKLLYEYLQSLPVHTLVVPNVEADDVIACLHKFYRERKKVIASTDNDFLQLLDANTIIYKPYTKTFYTLKDCLAEHQIHPANFGLARAIAGDKSDNLSGVPGIGLKTIAKLVPELAQEKPLEINDLLHAIKDKKEPKYKLLVKNEQLIRDTYSIMQLSVPLISMRSMQTVHEAVKQVPTFSKTNLIVKLSSDGIDVGLNFFATFQNLAWTGKQFNVG